MRSSVWIAAAAAICLGVSFTASARAPAIASVTALPLRLSETGLFVQGSTTLVRPDVLAYSPQYPLWSDGATKRRWVRLPPGTFIDATRPDAWAFPAGTRLWKEFSLGARRVETRLIERLASGEWRYATYLWNEDESDALLAPSEGIRALAVGGKPDRRYAIPSQADCRACHEGPAVAVLGFSALQLSPDRDPLAPHSEPKRADEVDLRALVSLGWLRNLPQTLVDIPPRIAAASAAERAALGYLHGNCGHCHGSPSDSVASVPVAMLLAQNVAEPERAGQVLRSLRAGSRFRAADGHAPQLVVPGDSSASVLPLRMRSREPRIQMPPLGTSIPDSEALALIERWIDHELQAN